MERGCSTKERSEASRRLLLPVLILAAACLILSAGCGPEPPPAERPDVTAAGDGETAVPLIGTTDGDRTLTLPSRSAPGDRPSLIIWLVDTLREDHMGSYGYPRATTPHTDAFARGAVQFRNMLSNSSWTKASIATFFTGLHPSAHGAVGRTDSLLPQVETLAQRLGAVGYRTAAWSANAVFHSTNWDISRGFDELFTYAHIRVGKGRRTLAILSDLGPWLDAVGDGPVFLFIHTIDPHGPYHPPSAYSQLFSGDYRGRFTKRVGDPSQQEQNATEADIRQFEALYDSDIAFGDHCFGRFVAMLKQRGLFDPSYVLFLSDHGEEFNEHSDWGHGQSLHEEQLRLPLLLRLPEGRQSGTLRHGVVRGIDLMPSLLDWLGVEGPEGPGESFAAAVEAGRDPADAEVLAEQALDSDRLYSLTSGRYKYILRLAPQREEGLYDLEADPAEQTNLFGTHPGLAAPLAARVAAYRESAERGTRVMFVDPDRGTARGEIVAGSPISMVRGINLSSRQGVTHGLSEDRRRLWFELTTARKNRGIVFDLERPDLGATLHLDRRDDGRAWPVFLGAESRRATADPVDLAGPELLAGTGRSIGRSDPQVGCFVWRVPGGGDSGPAELSEEEIADLRALGYLE